MHRFGKKWGGLKISPNFIAVPPLKTESLVGREKIVNEK